MVPGTHGWVGGCAKCGNEETNEHGQCTYCVWKGDIGPGADLKEILKTLKKETTDDRQRNSDT